MSGRWHTIKETELLEKMGTGLKNGLDEEEAANRLIRFGRNELAKPPKVPLWQMFLGQFKDFMVLVLLAATVISGFLGEWADAVTIMIIVVVNAVLGFVQEYRAEKSMEALKQLTAPEAKVQRDGQEKRIPAIALVPGDIVLLESGDKIPADLRLLEAHNLAIEESTLTGESVPVRKQPGILPEGTGLGDMNNMAFQGTVVTRGRGKGLVVATGMATEMGQIAGLIHSSEEEATPLQRRLAQLGKILVSSCLAICALVVAVGVMRGEPAYQMFLAGVSLAVAAIPEGLPAIVTVALAVGVQRMIKRNAIIRKLRAVETLGCSTVICSDKTGTLTQNEMTVRKIICGLDLVDVSGEGYIPQGKFDGSYHKKDLQMLLKAAALCNNSGLAQDNISIGGLFRGMAGSKKTREWRINGDPTEGALLVMSAKGGVWREHIELKEKRIAEFPFDSDRKRMTVIYRDAGAATAYVKGAPDIILEHCTKIYRNGRVLPISNTIKKEIINHYCGLADQALRVLALAYRELPGGAGKLNEKNIEQDLVFLGLAGMIDPPRPSAVKAVKTAKRAGIKTVMITGDHQLTAQAVGRELGIFGKGSRVLTGADLECLSDDELRREAAYVSVYARVSPHHKLRIVRALKRNGHIVAMTGDGVNDAPAVKEADIGISMGIAGTDVTKEASAMVLADDNFTTIVAAVEEGRGIYDNIRKFIRYLLSCNVGEVLTMLAAVLAGLPLPLLPIQILWMNLVTDGLPAMALGVDPSDRDIMFRKPRDPRESVFSHGLAWRIIGSGMVIGLGTIAAFLVGLSAGDLDQARTMAFNTLVFSQLFYVFTCRSEFHTIIDIGFFSNSYLILAVLISAVLQLAVDYLPVLQPIFHTVALNGSEWLIVLAISVAPAFISTIFKHIQMKTREKIMYLRV
ncbi:ATPase, P-type (transporting), HAD superfamily, subfamily IC [Desulfofarcimen acetoxidans DSM 771]|uniref:P-type Ca(2+) transporter n=1 Tax=Desulfofarcimen acetoxidans (strain ATCC 49208 / DSM 771 / KCTC 5769 / VKM B-1644 / 5575) TaxID=485916 RepID=C8W081_DESAS|nr:calcium-translocating P-type ATPase, SERCA-type [Desulfofarcimen acetoxidans]ACV63136.1 ATPase, P-type (transporting), HAD superfamily, subfamily IC [Desulfofarcimen acetoxidans DSM 771]